ncbi:IclR family transcriptional regulator [Humibacter ginsengiterrae]
MATRQLDAKSVDNSYSSRSVQRVCDILDALAAAPLGATLSEVAAMTDMPRSTAFRYLGTLEERRFVERDSEGNLFRLGQAFGNQPDSSRIRLAAVAQPTLEKLRDQLGETTNLGILEGTSVVHELVLESPQIMRVAARPGERGMVHATALGKAMCAELPPERILAILDAAGLPAITPRTITDINQFDRELQRVRKQGYGLDDAENQADALCIAVAIPRVPLPAAISISAPASRLGRDDVPSVARKLAVAAATISRHFNS